MKLKVLAFAVTSLVSVGISGTAAADTAGLYSSKCATCHGGDGKNVTFPGAPRVAGQIAAYASQQIKDIRDGKRTNGKTMMMKGVVSGVTDDEADALGTYLEGL